MGFGGVLVLFGSSVTAVGLVDGRDAGLVLRVLELAGGALPEEAVVELGNFLRRGGRNGGPCILFLRWVVR